MGSRPETFFRNPPVQWETTNAYRLGSSERKKLDIPAKHFLKTAYTIIFSKNTFA